MVKKVVGELYESITGQLFEIGCQLRQAKGYPFDPNILKKYLQNAIDGRFIVNEPKFVLTRPFDPAEFIRKDWTIWKGPIDGNGLSGEENVDLRSLSFKKISLADFLFKTCLRKGENFISGKEKLRRLKEEESDFIRFGGNVFLGLWENYKIDGKDSILQQLYCNFGVTSMDFMGHILRSPHGNLNVLYLSRVDSGEWYWDYYDFSSKWNIDKPSVGCVS